MMRRRALLAASQTEGGGTYDDIFGEIPPESTEFGWPLYITIPFKEDDEYGKSYYLESNEITQQLRQWVLDNNEEGGSPWMPEYYAYPPELYINGVKVEYSYTIDISDMWDIMLYQQTFGDYNFGWCTLYADGSIDMYLRKKS